MELKNRVSKVVDVFENEDRYKELQFKLFGLYKEEEILLRVLREYKTKVERNECGTELCEYVGKISDIQHKLEGIELKIQELETESRAILQSEL